MNQNALLDKETSMVTLYYNAICNQSSINYYKLMIISFIKYS